MEKPETPADSVYPRWWHKPVSILNSLTDGTNKRIGLHRIPELSERSNKRQKLDFSVIFSASDGGKLFRSPYNIKD